MEGEGDDDDEYYRVWEIKAQSGMPGEQEAKKMLERVANQVQPIMQKHKWHVKLLSEVCSPRSYGCNIGQGDHVRLKLRNAIWDWVPYTFEKVLDTMLHQLCHNRYNVSTCRDGSCNELLNQLRKECAELRAKGISGPVGRRVGGDKGVMSALSPAQAAAMAAEKRLQEKIQCASESEQELSEFQRTGTWGRKKLGIYEKGSSSATPRFGTWGRRKILKCVEGTSSAMKGKRAQTRLQEEKEKQRKEPHKQD